MRFVFVMDTLDRVDPEKDTTFAFIEAAQARGHESLHCGPADLGIREGKTIARVPAQASPDGVAWSPIGR